MEIKKSYMVAIKKDSSGKVQEVIEVKTINEDTLKQLKSEASNYSSQKQLSEEELNKEEIAKAKRLYIKAVAISKALFNELVDSGKAQTTSEFEEMFDKFILGGAFDESIAPTKYLDILARLK